MQYYTYEEDLQAKHREFEKLMSYDTFERTSSKESTMGLTWVKRIGSGVELKARLCARGFNEPWPEEENNFAPTPLGAHLKVILCRAHRKRHRVQLGDVSRLFLHAPVAGDRR